MRGVRAKSMPSSTVTRGVELRVTAAARHRHGERGVQSQVFIGPLVAVAPAVIQVDGGEGMTGMARADHDC